MSEIKPLRLSKNAWHAKLMKWIWNFKPTDFPWGCPYFWLSVVNVVIVIPFTPLKLLCRVIGWSYEKYDKVMDFYVNTRYEKLYNNLLQNPALITEVGKNKKLTKFLDWIWGYRSEHPMSADIIQQLRDRRAQWKSDHSEYKYQRSLTNKERITKLTKFTKPIATVIIWALVLFVGFFLVKWLIMLVVYLWHLPGKSWRSFWIVVGETVFGVGIVVLLCLLGNRIDKTQWWDNFTDNIANGFRGVFRSIGNFFKFIIDVIKNACPAIVWED